MGILQCRTLVLKLFVGPVSKWVNKIRELKCLQWPSYSITSQYLKLSLQNCSYRNSLFYSIRKIIVRLPFSFIGPSHKKFCPALNLCWLIGHMRENTSCLRTAGMSHHCPASRGERQEQCYSFSLWKSSLCEGNRGSEMMRCWSGSNPKPKCSSNRENNRTIFTKQFVAFGKLFLKTGRTWLEFWLCCLKD